MTKHYYQLSYESICNKQSKPKPLTKSKRSKSNQQGQGIFKQQTEACEYLKLWRRRASHGRHLEAGHGRGAEARAWHLKLGCLSWSDGNRGRVGPRRSARSSEKLPIGSNTGDLNISLNVVSLSSQTRLEKGENCPVLTLRATLIQSEFYQILYCQHRHELTGALIYSNI